jgi:mRNA interferase MazF
MAIRAAGQIAIVRFPHTDLAAGKARPVLLLDKTPGGYDDWLVCMISSRVEQAIPDFDEVIDAVHSDFSSSGLSIPSVIRVSRLAMVRTDRLLGKIGQIDPARLERIRKRIASWIAGTKG